MPDNFIDTNVLVYLLSNDREKADRAESLLRAGGVISVQVLNELANVSRRKFGLAWDEVAMLLADIRALLQVDPLDIAAHEEGIRIAQRYNLSVYDGMIVGAALAAGCDILWSEDMQNGLVVDERLVIRNPFG
ncbi:MAG: PIN domain-containing protein [Sphingomonadaceae bacterium]|nr:PIN domain-containing protein [Sphingomonadaceae bacterium]